MKQYNTIQLSPDTCFERHVYHRDQFAHFLRWTHVLKNVKIGMNILDFGCGSGNLAEVLYRNKFKANKYLGFDIRKQTINKANEKYKDVDWITFEIKDLVIDDFKQYAETKWDIIATFEVIEHIGKNNVDKFLMNILSCMNEHTMLMLSTTNYDESVGAANNHIIDGVIGEFEHKELSTILEKYFIIEKKYGTFASQKDYKHLLTDSQREFYNQVKDYFDSNILSNLMAPLFPEQSRNCLWIMKRK